jgi:hypothetical protein
MAFKDLAEAMEWARKEFPGCSLSVREQADGPTIVSIKGKKDGKVIREVVYVRKSGGDDED